MSAPTQTVDFGVELAATASDLATNLCGLNDLCATLRAAHAGCPHVEAVSTAVNNILKTIPKHATAVQAVIVENRARRATPCQTN